MFVEKSRGAKSEAFHTHYIRIDSFATESNKKRFADFSTILTQTVTPRGPRHPERDSSATECRVSFLDHVPYRVCVRLIRRVVDRSLWRSAVP
jgi:hypothetical protein